MGYGEVSGNQSVHWKMVHENPVSRKSAARAKTRQLNDAGAVDDVIRGRDPIPFDAIGVKGGHKGKFRVTLRFDTKAQAVAAALRLGKIEKVNEKYLLVVDVPAINRPSPDVDPPAEVQVEW